MKVLLVGLERVGKLFSMESLFKKKLTEADMTDVEVVTAEMTELVLREGESWNGA